MSTVPADRPIAIFYEHPDWFRPLSAEPDRRGTPYVKLHADEHVFDPAETPAYSLVFNRMSPNAYQQRPCLARSPGAADNSAAAV